MKDCKRDVVITGLGVVAPNGMNVTEFYENCTKGITGIKKSKILDEFSYSTKYVGEVSLQEDLRWEAKFKKIGNLACDEMLKDSGLSRDDIESAGNRAAFCMASANVGSLRLEPQLRYLAGLNIDSSKKDLSYISELKNVVYDFNSTDYSYYFCNKLGVQGAVYSINAACASGTMSVGTGYRLIKNNQADIVIAAGIDILSDLSLAGFNSMLNLTSKPCCPFDKKHDGINIGEGAAFLMLEDAESAVKRGAKIYGKIFGYTTSNDAYHITAPDPTGQGALWCMKKTLESRKSNKDEKLYVNTHGTSTKANDSMELKALEDLQSSSGIDHIWFSSTKSMIGHCLGASGNLELVCSVKGLADGKMPLSISVDDKMDFDESKLTLVTDEADSVPYDVLLSNSFAFAGNSSSIGVEKWA